MRCKHCKTILPDTAKVCANCGLAVLEDNQIELIVDVELDGFEIIEDINQIDTPADLDAVTSDSIIPEEEEIHEFKSRYQKKAPPETEKNAVTALPKASLPKVSFPKVPLLSLTLPDMKALDRRILFGAGSGLGVLLLAVLLIAAGRGRNIPAGSEAASEQAEFAEAASLSYFGVSEALYIETLGLVDEFYSEDYMINLAGDFKEALIAAYGEDLSSLSGEAGRDVMISLPDVSSKKRRIASLSEADASSEEALLQDGITALYSLICEAAYGLALDETPESDFYLLSCQIYTGFDAIGFDLPGISGGTIGDGMDYLYEGITSDEHSINLEDSWRYLQVCHSFFKDID